MNGISPSYAEDDNPEKRSFDKLLPEIVWHVLQRTVIWADQKAENLYQSVIDNPRSFTILKERAQRGLQQVEFRLDNAHDTYRTLFDSVWWITKADPTFEWYDDSYMLALGNAYKAVEAHFEREIDPENHFVWFW